MFTASGFISGTGADCCTPGTDEAIGRGAAGARGGGREAASCRPQPSQTAVPSGLSRRHLGQVTIPAAHFNTFVATARWSKRRPRSRTDSDAIASHRCRMRR
jgi:hypothetical protein